MRVRRGAGDASVGVAQELAAVGLLTDTERTREEVRHAPEPPSGDFDVTPVGVALQLSLELVPTLPQPAVTGVEVVLVGGPVGVVRHLCGVLLDGPPTVRHVPVGVVDDLQTREGLWPCQENCTRPRERLHVRGHTSEGFPHGVRDHAFAPGVRERGFGGRHERRYTHSGVARIFRIRDTTETWDFTDGCSLGLAAAWISATRTAPR